MTMDREFQTSEPSLVPLPTHVTTHILSIFLDQAAEQKTKRVGGVERIMSEKGKIISLKFTYIAWSTQA